MKFKVYSNGSLQIQIGYILLHSFWKSIFRFFHEIKIDSSDREPWITAYL